MSKKKIRKKILLSIGILVSDRSETAEKCLESLAPIRKAISTQVIVTLTSDKPELKSTVRKYADVVSHFQWCDDFAAARNENLSHAIGEWYMYLDDDEWFCETEHLIGFFTSGFYKKCDGAGYIQRNYYDTEGTFYTDDFVSRMIRRTPDVHFVSRIHEYMIPVPQNTCLLSSYVEHYGYIFASDDERQKHYERNHSLLLKMMEEEPDNQRHMTHMTSEYMLAEDYEGLWDFSRECLKKLDVLEDQESRFNRGTFYVSLAIAEDGMSRYEELLSVCDEALADERNTMLCQAFMHWWRGKGCYRLNRYEESQKELEIYLDMHPKVTARETEYALERMALRVSHCYDEIKIQEAYGILVSAGLRRGDADGLRKYLDRFKWNTKNHYIFEDLPELLLLSFADMKEDEDIFLKTVERLHENEDLWAKIWDAVTDLFEREDDKVGEVLNFFERAGYTELVMSFLGWIAQKLRLCQGTEASIYPEYRKEFANYVGYLMKYNEEIYGSDFREREKLPKQCLFGVMAETALAYEDDKENFKYNIKVCATLSPALADFLKKLLTAYLLEPERKQREAREEMRLLREQMISKTQELIEAGQREAAIAVAGQLKQIFPEDLEIASLVLKAQMTGFVV